MDKEKLLDRLQDSIEARLDPVSLIDGSGFFGPADGGRDCFKLYWQLFNDQIEWELELSKRAEKLNRKLSRTESEQIPMYQQAVTSNRALNDLENLLRQVLRAAVQYRQLSTEGTGSKIKDERFAKLSKTDFPAFTREFSQEMADFLEEKLTTTGITKTMVKSRLPLALREHQKIIPLLQNHAPDRWYGFYNRIDGLTGLETTWHFRNFGNIRLGDKTPLAWLQELLQPYRERLIQEHPEVQDQERETERQACIALIKELLLELREGDEVTLDKAVQVVQAEGEYGLVTAEFMARAFRKVANDLPEFEYVRLKEVIRRKSTVSDNLAAELDRAFREWQEESEKKT